MDIPPIIIPAGTEGTLGELLKHIEGGAYSVQIERDANRVISCLQWIKSNMAYIEYFVDHKNDISRFKISPADAEKGVIRDHNGTSMHFNSYTSGKQAKQALETYIKQFEEAFLIARAHNNLSLFVEALEYNEKIGCIEARTSRAIEIASMLAATGNLDLDMLFAAFEKQEQINPKEMHPGAEKWQRTYKFFEPAFFKKSAKKTRVGAATATALKLSNNEDVLIELDKTHVDDYLVHILAIEIPEKIRSSLIEARLLQVCREARKEPEEFLITLNRIPPKAFAWEVVKKHSAFLFLIARWQSADNFLEAISKVQFQNLDALWDLKNSEQLSNMEDSVSLFRIVLTYQRFERMSPLWTQLSAIERLSLLTKEEGTLKKPNIHIGLQYQKTLQDMLTLLDNLGEQNVVECLTTPNTIGQSGFEIALMHQREAGTIFFLLANFQETQIKAFLRNKSNIAGSLFQIAFLCQSSEVVGFFLKNFLSRTNENIFLKEKLNKDLRQAGYLDSEYFSLLKDGDTALQIIVKRKLVEPVKAIFSNARPADIRSVLQEHNSIGESGCQTTIRFLPEVLKTEDCLLYFKEDIPNIDKDVASHELEIQEITQLVKEGRFLIKLSHPNKKFIDTLADYNNRPPLRRAPLDSASVKFRHMTGEIEPYSPKKHSASPYTHTRKTSMTWIDPSLSTPLVDNRGTVGFGFDINHCVVKALIASGTMGSYYRDWVGSPKKIQQYADDIKDVNYTDQALFFQKITEDPQINEVLARTSREALRCVIFTVDNAETRLLAIHARDEVQKKLNRHVPIVFYDLPFKQLRFLYDKPINSSAFSFGGSSTSRKRLHSEDRTPM